MKPRQVVNTGEVYLMSESKADIYSDGHTLKGFADNHFDFIVSQHTLEHLVNPIKALMRWRELLKDRGVVIALVPLYPDFTPLDTLIERFHKDVDTSELCSGHPSMYCPNTLKTIFELSGLGIVKAELLGIINDIRGNSVQLGLGYIVGQKREV